MKDPFLILPKGKVSCRYCAGFLSKSEIIRLIYSLSLKLFQNGRVPKTYRSPKPQNKTYLVWNIYPERKLQNVRVFSLSD